VWYLVGCPWFMVCSLTAQTTAGVAIAYPAGRCHMWCHSCTAAVYCYVAANAATCLGHDVPDASASSHTWLWAVYGTASGLKQLLCSCGHRCNRCNRHAVCMLSVCSLLSATDMTVLALHGAMPIVGRP
jgi:hypothetical protein